MSCPDFPDVCHVRHGHASWRKCFTAAIVSRKSLKRTFCPESCNFYVLGLRIWKGNLPLPRTFPVQKSPAETASVLNALTETSAVQNAPAEPLTVRNSLRFLVSKAVAGAFCTASRHKRSELNSAVHNAQRKDHVHPILGHHPNLFGSRSVFGLVRIFRVRQSKTRLAEFTRPSCPGSERSSVRRSRSA